MLGQTKKKKYLFKKSICSDNELISWVDYFVLFSLSIYCFDVLFSSKLDMFYPLIFVQQNYSLIYFQKRQWSQMLNFWTFTSNWWRLNSVNQITDFKLFFFW